MGVVSRLKTGELIVGAWIVVWSLAMWWGAGFFHGTAPFPVFLIAFVASAIGFAAVNIVDNTDRNVRRIVVVISFLAAVPLTLLDTGAWGLASVIFAILFLETAQIRTARFRDNLRNVRMLSLARFLLPEYFSAVSLVISVVILFSPVGVKILENPLPEQLLRTVLQIVDVSSVKLPPQLNFTSPETRKQFSQLIGVDIESDDDLAAVTSKVINGQTKKLEASYGDLYRLTFFLGIFALFRVFAIPLSWIVMPFLYLFLNILRSLRRVSLVEEPIVRSVMKWE